MTAAILRRSFPLLALSVALAGCQSTSAPNAALQQPASPEPLSDAQAHAIAVDAYLYFYPLISMDVTRRQATNIELGKELGKGPMNTFSNIPIYPPADFKAVVRPNFDTLYSSAFLDMTHEPVVVTVPDTGGRYYLLPMLDMWSDVFASPGSRTTGNRAATFLILPPGTHEENLIRKFNLPDNTQSINTPTPYVWIIGRTKTDGPSDYDAVHKIQAGYTVTPLSQWGKPAQLPTVQIDPTVDMKTPPKVQVDTMPIDRYLACAAEILKTNPPHLTDEPILAQLRRLGFAPGKSFDLAAADPQIQKAFAGVPEEAQALMKWKLNTLARVANGWSMNADTMGVYGNYYLKRAIVAQFGLGANLPEDAIYPVNLADADGKPLDGAHTYTLHFAKSDLPPVDAFWSITLYDNDGFQVANPLNRFAVSSWMPFVYNVDGSLDLYFQNASPGTAKEFNWLPAPAGPFNLTMRLYSPKSDALTGKWNPPPVKRAD